MNDQRRQFLKACGATVAGNRGDRLDYLTSMSSADFTLGHIAKELAAKDTAYRKYVNMSFEGNMNTSCTRFVEKQRANRSFGYPRLADAHSIITIISHHNTV